VSIARYPGSRSFHGQEERMSRTADLVRDVGSLGNVLRAHRADIVARAARSLHADGGAGLSADASIHLVEQLLGRVLPREVRRPNGYGRPLAGTPEQSLRALAYLREALAEHVAELERGGADWQAIERAVDLEMRSAAEEVCRVAADERRARESAEHATRAKDEFLALISHELRAPLHAILGWAQLARARDWHPDVDERAFDVIERNARVQVRLVDDLLDVHRIATGTMRLNLQQLDLRRVVEHAADEAAALAASQRISLDVSLPEETVPVRGDPDRLGQIIGNLLSNSLRFTPPGGHISLEVRADAAAHLVVADTGKGIEEDVLPRLFAPLWHAPATTSRRGGLGIGLALVRHLVELHRGTVSAASGGEGRGTRITIELPLDRGANGPS
jgi:signal transduction histidine kinase